MHGAEGAGRRGSRAWGLEGGRFKVQALDLGLRDEVGGFKAEGLRFGVQGLGSGFRVQGLGLV